MFCVLERYKQRVDWTPGLPLSMTSGAKCENFEQMAPKWNGFRL